MHVLDVYVNVCCWFLLAAGFAELGETLEQAVGREVAEESGGLTAA